jgi:cytoskeleton protein RodZ
MNAGPFVEGSRGNAGDDRLSIGRQLSDARKRQKLDIETVARTLKLDTGIIRALESDDRDSLPASIYVQGYLRNYARLVELPGEELVRAYVAHSEALPPLKVVRVDSGRKGLRLPRARLVRNIILVLLAVIMAWLAYPFVEKLVASRNQEAGEPAPGYLELPPVPELPPAPELPGRDG